MTSPTPTYPLPALPSGRAVSRADGGFEQARRAWNLAVDQHPVAVVFPESTLEVSTCVRFAREHGQRVAAQGTGHNAGPLGPLEDTVLVKTERMRGLHIDAARMVARVEAGVVWGDVLAAVAAHGLTALAGSSPNVGVIGYLLGGGLSFLGRTYGVAANHVRAIDLVTADGQVIRADRDHEPELFWALRGGGGSFGVVTATEVELLPLTQAYAGVLWYPIERGPEALSAWSQMTRPTAPDDLTTVAPFLRFPPAPEFPEPVRGKSFTIVAVYHVGDPDVADALLEPLRTLGPIDDTIQTIPVSTLGSVFPDPEGPISYAGDSLLLSQLPQPAVDAFVATAGDPVPSPLMSVELRHLQGAFARTPSDGGAVSSVDASHVMYAVGVLPTPDSEVPVRAQLDTVKAALGQGAAPQLLANLTETSQPPGALGPSRPTSACDRSRPPSTPTT